MQKVHLSVLLGTALAFAPSLMAQQPTPAREGLYVNLGTGGGSVGYSCTGCEIDRTWGSAGNFGIGVALSPNVLIGADIVGWINFWNSDDITYMRNSFLAMVTFYPSSAPSGFWISAGGGYSLYSEKLGTDKLAINGVEALGRLGYDFRVGRNFSVAPYGEFGFSFGSNVKANGTDTGISAKTNVVNFGVIVTFH
jgi:hypothetical protein